LKVQLVRTISRTRRGDFALVPKEVA